MLQCRSVVGASGYGGLDGAVVLPSFTRRRCGYSPLHCVQWHLRMIGISWTNRVPFGQYRRTCSQNDKRLIKQGVALTGRNRTGPPRSVSRPIAHAPGRRRADRPRARRPRRRRQTMTDASQQNNTGPVAGPVLKCRLIICRLSFKATTGLQRGMNMPCKL